MKNMLRWAAFTAAVALIGLALAFGILFIGRLYLGLQQSALVFTVLMFYSIGVTIAAINYASKLEEEANEAAEADGARQPQTRALVPIDDRDA